MRTSKVVIAAFVALLAMQGVAHAQGTPVGLWKTIDDDSHAEQSLVRIAERGGVLTGTIEKLLDPTTPAGQVCDKCSDDRKNKPLLGLDIIRDTRHDADDPALWNGGEILDPGNGKTYRLRLKPIEAGRKLEVRGYIGTPMLGRTQVWLRVE